MRKSHKQKVWSRREKKSDKIKERLISRLESFWFNSYKDVYEKEYPQAFIPEIDVKASVLTKEKLEECYKLIKEFYIKPFESTRYDCVDAYSYYPLMYGGVTAKNTSICVLPNLVDTEVKS